MKTNRMIPLGAGLLIYLFIGLIYGWSIFVSPLEAEFGWNRAATSGIFTLSMICFCLGGVLSGIIIKKRPATMIIRISAMLLLIGFVLGSRTQSLPTIYIAYGMFCGTGVGLSYNSVISTVTKWFPDKMGLASGILLMCFGCGGMVLGTVASNLIGSMGWRTTFVVLGVLFAVILLLCSIWIKPPSSDYALPAAEGKKRKVTESFTSIDMTTAQMMKRPSFWLYFSWTTLLSAAGLAIIGHASVCAQDMGATVTFATLITGTISICNGLGRVMSGYVFDEFGRKKSIILANSLTVGAFAILIYSVWQGSPVIFMAGAVFMGLGYGAIPSINSAFTNMFFGSKNYPLNFSVMNSCLIPAALLGPLVAGGVKTATGSYLPVLILLLGLAVLCFAIQQFIKKP